MLPRGLPLRFTRVIQAGGLPRRFPRPAARRSSTTIASATCSRSARSSSSILLMSMSGVYYSDESNNVPMVAAHGPKYYFQFGCPTNRNHPLRFCSYCYSCSSSPCVVIFIIGWVACKRCSNHSSTVLYGHGLLWITEIICKRTRPPLVISYFLRTSSRAFRTAIAAFGRPTQFPAHGGPRR